MDGDFVFRTIFMVLALLLALTLHEFAHAWTAVRAGDPTPAMQGRVTLNPLAHLDMVGTIMFLLAGIGWAKPVQVNPANFRYPSRDMVITSAAGPVSNILQGTFWGILLRVALTAGVKNELLLGFLALVTLINYALAIFNLIPLGPLDGHEILAYFLPYRLERKFRALNQYGFAILIGIVLLSHFARIPILSLVVFVPADVAGSLLAGEHLLYLTGKAGIF